MKYLMAPIWLASFLRNDRGSRTRRSALSQGVVEAFDAIRFAGFRNGCMLGWWNHSSVSFVLICIEGFVKLLRLRRSSGTREPRTGPTHP